MKENEYTLPLFDCSTSEQARRISSQKVGDRYTQIINVLATGPACIFEVAQALGCFDHQISGRFGEMVQLGLIEKTGDRRTKQSTGCQAEVYRIAGEIEQTSPGTVDAAGSDERSPTDCDQAT
jgi:hypothetical protein